MHRHNSAMIDLDFLLYPLPNDSKICLKRKLSKADFSNFEYFFSNAIFESRVAKLNVISKWMIIQFCCKVIIKDLCAINEREKLCIERPVKFLCLVLGSEQGENNTKYLFLHA